MDVDMVDMVDTVDCVDIVDGEYIDMADSVVQAHSSLAPFPRCAIGTPVSMTDRLQRASALMCHPWRGSRYYTPHPGFATLTWAFYIAGTLGHKYDAHQPPSDMQQPKAAKANGRL